MDGEGGDLWLRRSLLRLKSEEKKNDLGVFFLVVLGSVGGYCMFTSCLLYMCSFPGCDTTFVLHRKCQIPQPSASTQK